MRHQDVSRHSERDLHAGYTGQERRNSPRMRTPLRVKVQSSESPEPLFEEDTILDNFSSQGLYFRLARRAEQGIKLLVLLRCAVAPDATTMVAWLELQGIVLRTEEQSGGRFGTAIRLTHHRYIYTTTPSNYYSIAC
jgi:hypothetical protein